MEIKNYDEFAESTFTLGELHHNKQKNTKKKGKKARKERKNPSSPLKIIIYLTQMNISDTLRNIMHLQKKKNTSIRRNKKCHSLSLQNPIRS